MSMKGRPLNRPMLKRPRPMVEEEGIEFARAMADAAALGLTLWHMCEEWNGRWYVRLGDPNSNATEAGDSISYGRSGDTPAEAVRNTIANFGPTADEKAYKKLIDEIRDTDPLRAPVVVHLETIKRLEAAIERNISERSVMVESDDDDL